MSLNNSEHVAIFTIFLVSHTIATIGFGIVAKVLIESVTLFRRYTGF